MEIADAKAVAARSWRGNPGEVDPCVALTIERHGVTKKTPDGKLRMQRLARRLGITVTTGADCGTMDLRLALNRHEKT